MAKHSVNTIQRYLSESEIAEKLVDARLATGFYNVIGGERASSDARLPVVNPATGKELATVPDANYSLLSQAVSAARTALPGWSAVSLPNRQAALTGLLNEIEKRADELTVLLTAEQGRPLSQTRWEIDLLTKAFGLLRLELPERELDVQEGLEAFCRLQVITTKQ